MAAVKAAKQEVFTTSSGTSSNSPINNIRIEEKVLVKRFIALVLLGLYPLWTVAAGQLGNARLAELPDGTQIVFDLDTPIQYRSFLLDNPPRFVVDLMDTRLDLSRQQVNLRSVDVQRVRTGIQRGFDLRIVVDLLNATNSQAYLLDNPAGEGQHLVIDIFRDRQPEPGEQLPRPHRLAQVERTLQGVGQFVVAIDPGHGGKDPGAIGSRGTQEKKVVMQIARHLKKLMDEEPGIQGVLTRDKDIYLHLYDRIRIAREQQADLFVSLHADAFTNRKARGSSVFILSTKGASSAAARWLAKQENEADFVGGGQLKVKDKNLKPVVFDIYHDAILAESMRLAEQMLGQLKKVGPVHQSAVERAGFAVLKAPDMPSVLVETAFISNPQEEEKLTNERHQKQIAQAILDGIKGYLENRPPKYMVAGAAVLTPPERETSSRESPLTAEASQVIIPAAGDTEPSLAVSQQVSESNTASRPVSEQVASPPSTSVDLIAASQAYPSVSSRESFSEEVTERIHIIQRGESLTDIATRYQIDVSQLRSSNGLSNNQLRMPAGTFLIIPLSDS
jgi:N-acetylmuramoyl-L-alanine amidase